MVSILFAFALFTNPVCPKGPTIPVVSWLTPHLDGAIVEGIPVSDPAILSSILNLKGEPVAWNGYGSASPFGSFNYPHNGDWRGMVWLISGANRYQLWLWWSSTARPDRVLAFLFWDMEWTDEAYNGQHHFCMASVAASDWEQIEAAIQ